MTAYGALLGTISKDGVPVELGNGLNFTGAGVTVTRNAATGKIDIAIAGGGGGSAGGGMGFRFTYSTATADADPGAGTFRASNAALASAIALYVDLTEFGGTDVTAWLDALDDTASAIKGVIRLSSLSDPTKWIEYNLTAWTTAAGYRKLTVAYRAGPGGLLTTAGDTFIAFDAIGFTGTVATANIAADAVTFAKLLNATAAGVVIGADAAGDFKELTLAGGVERSGTTVRVSDQLPARGGENVIIDLYPSSQSQGTLATATTQNFDVAVPAGKRACLTASIWADNGAGGTCLYTKELRIMAHITGGVAVKVADVTGFAPLEGAGFTFTATANSTNIRFALNNSSGSTRSYNIAVGSWSMDLP